MIVVIVESPSKCKRIESYLGTNYKVIATSGHFRKMSNLDQIDFSTFKVKYENTNTKVIKRLREETSTATEVILATDDDREGEMIAWHICQVCKLPLDTKRILFREITKQEIIKAINSPETIKMNRVYSQNARQIIDIYIGFKISPLLWKYVKHTLSAGRCQTPALHLIAERERAIEEQGYETNYQVSGFFTNKDIEFRLDKHLEDCDVKPFLDSLKDHIFHLSRNTKEVSDPPPPILNTSLLQQLPLSMSPQRIMRAAQTLYENGLITYMRTESCVYSEDFLKTASTYLGDKFCRPKMEPMKTHEGIRVTQLEIDIICLDADSNKLYTFLHKYTLQTCMKPAVLLHKIYTTECPNKMKFVHTSILQVFNGWKDDSKRPDWSTYLDCLKMLTYNSIHATEVFKSQEFHLSESQLIKQLEKRNIGRPSTYTNILESIEKNYVSHGKITGKEYSLNEYKLDKHNVIESSVICKKIEETNKLTITEIGKEVDRFCYKHFETIFNYDYTNQMEVSLDLIEKGEKDWKQVIREYIAHVDSLLGVEDVKKVYSSLHAGYYKESPLVIKDGVHGFYAEYKDKSVSLSNYKEKEMIYTWIVDQSIPEESFNSLIEFVLKDKVVMHITDSWSVRTGPRGNYLYFKAKNMKQPKFYSCPEGLTRDELEKHIRNKYKTI
jgi:DNA topoisomerase-1